MEHNEDLRYVEDLKQGSLEAFDWLFKKYAEKLYAFVLSISKEPYKAEEVTQLVFIKIWEKRTQIKAHFSFKSFLFAIAYNETISLLRKEKSEKLKIDKVGASTSFVTNETNYSIEFNNINSLAQKLIDELPERRRLIFKLSREQGLANKEIASKLDISIKTVENQITTALKTLREKLHKSEISGVLFYFITYH